MLPPKRKRRPGRFARFMHRVAVAWGEDFASAGQLGKRREHISGCRLGDVGNPETRPSLALALCHPLSLYLTPISPKTFSPSSPPPHTHTDLQNVASIGILVLLAYGALVGAAGKGFYPPTGAFFTVLLVWSSAHLGGLVLSRLLPVMPPLLGMLAAGVLLRNVPGDAARGLSEKAASKIRYGCLAVIFLQSGLEQDPSIFK